LTNSAFLLAFERKAIEHPRRRERSVDEAFAEMYLAYR
jgi:hypothetical protein